MTNKLSIRNIDLNAVSFIKGIVVSFPLIGERPVMNHFNRGAVYPGSFDPITKGHVDLVKRLSCFFNPLVLLVSTSASKQYLFSLKERVDLARVCLKNIKGVQVSSCEGLTVEYMKKKSIKMIIRGVRAVSDFEYELTMAGANKQLWPECETFIAFTRPEYTHLSSQVVKEIALHGGDLSNWIPKPVAQAIKKKYN